MGVASSIVAEGLRLHKAGDLRAARRCYEQACKKDPFDFDAIHLIGVLALQEGRLDNAIRLFHLSLRLKPDVAEAWIHLGDAYAGKGNAEAALAVLSKALAVKPEHFGARNKRAHLLRSVGRVEDALEDYDFIAAANEYALPQDVRAAAHLRRVECLAELGRIEQARAVLDFVQKTHPQLKPSAPREAPELPEAAGMALRPADA